jgi:hypothetical protein
VCVCLSGSLTDPDTRENYEKYGNPVRCSALHTSRWHC